MNENQLKSFVLSADKKSFSKAAASSFISTSALVQQINLLEKNLGFKLFIRKHNGVELTAAGKIFYNASLTILDTYNNAVDSCRKLQYEKEHTLRIGYTQEMFPDFFMKMLDRFCEEYPNIRSEFIPCHFGDFFDNIRNDIIDLGMLMEPSDEFLEGLKFLPIKADNFAFCMKPGNPLAQKNIITMKDLKNITIYCGRTNYMKIPFENHFRGNGKFIVTNQDYNLTDELRNLENRNVYIILQEWSKYHESFLTVIPSDIYAGYFGIIYKADTPPHVRNFIDSLT